MPEARGKAQRMMEEASAYREEVVARAEGEATRFSKLLAEYQKAPEVTRERLYLVAMEDVLSNSNKVLVDVDGGNNMMVLPLDQIMNSAKRSTSSYGGGSATSADIDEITNQVIQELGTRTTTRISTRESR